MSATDGRAGVHASSRDSRVVDERRDRLRALRARYFAEASQLPLGDDLRALLCRVGDQRIAVPLSEVQEVLPAAATAPLPEAPVWVEGVLNVAGAATVVLDLEARLTGARRALDVDDLILVCDVGVGSFGIVVQDVLGMAVLAADDLQQPAADVPHADYLLGTFVRDDRLATLLSVHRLMASSGIAELLDAGADR